MAGPRAFARPEPSAFPVPPAFLHPSVPRRPSRALSPALSAPAPILPSWPFPRALTRAWRFPHAVFHRGRSRAPSPTGPLRLPPPFWPVPRAFPGPCRSPPALSRRGPFRAPSPDRVVASDRFTAPPHAVTRSACRFPARTAAAGIALRGRCHGGWTIPDPDFSQRKRCSPIGPRPPPLPQRLPQSYPDPSPSRPHSAAIRGLVAAWLPPVSRKTAPTQPATPGSLPASLPTTAALL